MRDKKNVDAYKASIKAQLSRAGLIRGQPRHNPMQVPSQREQRGHHSRQTTHNGSHNSSHNSSPASVARSSAFDSFHHQLVEPPFVQNTNDHLIPVLPGASSSTYDQLSAYPLFDTPTNFFSTPPVPASSPYHNHIGPDSLEQNYLFPASNTGHLDFMDPPVASQYPLASGQSAVHEELVMHYFSNVRKVQFFFAGDALTDITYSAVVEEPRGAVTLAICALADLHSKQMRISQGLEAPNQTPENSSTSYLRHEALLRLETNKNTQHGWTDNDALAALHLVSLSQLSGGGSDWETPFSILCQWLIQTNLHHAENPWMAFLNLSAASQLNVKATLWLDIFSSLSKAQAPKFLPLWQNLLRGDRHNFWITGSELDVPQRLRMDLLTGCPDEAMLAIAEVSSLAHWKASQLRNNCLSYPELIRRGTVIEQQLASYQSDQLNGNDTPQTRLDGAADVTQPTDEDRSLIARIFRETANLYLHTVLSNSTPGVPEISTSVETIVRFFSQLPPSDIDRALVFPICLAGCMTNDSTRRDFLKGRIRGLNESYGNLLQVRRLMEAVWQKRDVSGKEVDVRETIQEQGLKLLLI